MSTKQIKDHREIFRERLREVLLIRIEDEQMARDKIYQTACAEAQAAGLPTPEKPEKFTQRSLAEELGISYTTLNSYINESYRPKKRKESAPQFDLLVLVAQKLNISIDYLMGFTEYRKLGPDSNWTYRMHEMANIERMSDLDADVQKVDAGKEESALQIDKPIDIERQISDYAGLSLKAIRLLHLYHCAAQAGRTMSSTINKLLENTSFGIADKDDNAMSKWIQDTYPKMNDFPYYEEEEPPEEQLSPEEEERLLDEMGEEFFEHCKDGSSNSIDFKFMRLLEHLEIGKSVLQLIDSYFSLEIRGDNENKYVITYDGKLHSWNDLESLGEIPEGMTGIKTTGVHLLDSFFLGCICEKLREMKYKKAAENVPW